MFPCEWTRIAPWTLSNCCSLFMPASPFLVLYSVLPVFFSLFCVLCSVPSPLRFIILSFLPKWKLMNVGKCFWQCARRRQHTEDSKLNVICQVASSSLSLFCKWVCVCVLVPARAHVLVCACMCEWMCVRHFVFCFISFPTAVCLCPVLQVHFSCQAAVPPPLFPLRSLGPFCLSPSHTYLTRLMCFKFNFFFRVLPHCICLFW